MIKRRCEYCGSLFNGPYCYECGRMYSKYKPLEEPSDNEVLREINDDIDYLGEIYARNKRNY